jgi:hypothetical protein
MVKQLSLDSFVSGGIARRNPIEHTPEFEAALSGSTIIPDTWGGYATRLMDLYDLEPSEAIAILGLTREQMADPEIKFGPQAYHRSPYSFFVHGRFYEEAQKDLKVEARRLRSVVDIVMSGYVLVDTVVANEEADKIQTKIESRELSSDEMNLACAERDASYSGVRISLDEFVATMLSVNAISGEEPSELAQLWVRSVKEVVEDICRKYVIDEESIVKNIVLGRDAFTEMKGGLNPSQEALEAAEDRWDFIKPVFTARPLREFSLLAGTEK